jgi:sugar phosphate isomerase/epimerase
MEQNRRTFLKETSTLALGVGMFGMMGCGNNETPTDKAETTNPEKPKAETPLLFDISLAQWSLHRTIRAGDLDNLDFASYALNQFGINAVEYVNQFFKDKADNSKYIAEMVKRSKDVGVKNLLIMVDGEGELGNLNDKERIKAVENHHKWALAAKFLGCHSIRVNAAGQGSREDVSKAAVDGLGRLSEFAKSLKINVIVENHGGYSSDGQWLSGVIKEVNMPNCGTLPDFGNFKVAEGNEYDRYKGVTELMPFAKAVSAKSHDFDSAGNEIHTDYLKMMKIVTEAGYGGYVGIEYEGNELSEQQGISATMALLQKVRTDLS